ncbi:MAG: hypothetical protein AB7V56_12800 [Candidatus Nitrosocosmicus sp.]
MSDPNDVIYLTHCCAKKNEDFKGTELKVTPDILYTATSTPRFMDNCKKKKIKWAIFSDKYGVWFSNIQNEWYEKNPNKVTEKEFDELVRNFDRSLRQFDKIYFYYNPGRFHKLYKWLLITSELKSKINLITHLKDIASQ